MKRKRLDTRGKGIVFDEDDSTIFPVLWPKGDGCDAAGAGGGRGSDRDADGDAAAIGEPGAGACQAGGMCESSSTVGDGIAFVCDGL